MKRRLVFVVLIFVLAAASLPTLPLALAAPGDLDQDFGGFLFYGPTFASVPRGMAVQADGKIVVVAATGNPYEFVLFRYHANGAPDPMRLGSSTSYVRVSNMFSPQAVAVQSDGSIVVAGGAFQLARFDSSGYPDETFDDDGRVQDSAAGRALYDMIIQPDGKIVAVGYDLVGGDNDFVITRYLPSGLRDNSFGGGDGRVTIGFGGDDTARDVARAPDGRLVVFGSNFGNFITEDDDLAVARLTTDGLPDDTFDDDGKLTIGFGDDEYGIAAAVQPDGKIVVLGSGNASTRMARLTLAGGFDGTFDNDGKLTIPGDDLVELAIQPDNGILLVGTQMAADGNNNIELRRLNTNGTPDETFDFDGIASFDVYGDDRGALVTLLSDGRILAAGSSGHTNGGGALALERLWPDGTPDTRGRQVQSLAFPPVYPVGSDVTALALAVQPDGWLVTAGQLQNPSNNASEAVVTRFTTEGDLDVGFGPGGTARLWVGRHNAARAVAIQPDGAILIAGYADWGNPWTDFLVARLQANGRPDTTFGLNGNPYRLMDFAGPPNYGADYGHALALAPDGKIVVAGMAWNGSSHVWGVARWNNDGTPDETFGPNLDGKALLDFGAGSAATAVVVQPDGKILLGGRTNTGDFAVARLLETGLPDADFGDGLGSTITDMGGNDGITALALGADGWFYAAGHSWRGGEDDYALTQYRPDGKLATCPAGETCSHWPEGKRFISLGGSDTAYALALRSDNQLVAAGCSDWHTAAAQVSTTTVSDTPLVFETDFVGHFDCAFGVRFARGLQDRIVLAGVQSYGPDSNIALARYETTANSAPPPTPAPAGNKVYLPAVATAP